MSISITTDDDYTQFKRLITPLVPMDLNDYKQQQMERRIRDLARKNGADSLVQFAQMLRDDRRLLRTFESHVTINVSEFFRNVEPFNYLGDPVLSGLVALGKPLTIWSAGCSYGAEPMTFAMILSELNPSLRHTIHATDIDPDMLAKARSGTGFSPADVQGLPKTLRARYMKQIGDDWAVSDDLVKRIKFAPQNLLKDPAPARNCDLVACRNVVIYFTDEAKSRLYKTFADSLRPGGYLFIGATEVVSGAASFGLRYVAPCFYQKEV